MSKHESKEVSFKLEGKFLGFEFEDGESKYLRLENLEGGEYYSIKLAKHLRLFKLDLQPGDWVQVVGEKKFNPKKGSLKLKAELVITNQSQANSVPPQTKPAKTANILVCQKSTCMKQGGKAVCQALQAAISDRGLDNVAIKGTGCLKQCKAGPNIIMPDKTRYCRIQADQIPKVIDRHFPATSADEQTKQNELATVATQHRR